MEGQAPRETPPPLPTLRSGQSNWRHWLIGTIVLLLVIFVGQNAQSVEVHFFLAKARMPLIFALLLAVVLGILVGWLVPRLRRSKTGEIVSK
ncbi:MAG: Lipopolysaccharide assembly protein domain [Solirubrobacterales bacterium]|nr:Lipopolysaccharide assembly protein domain [Solirubrobacterales bacterium]